MIAAIKPAGSNTRGLLAYLYGPGRHDEHTDPHIVASFVMLGMPDPGRDPDATLTQLARHLDAPVHLRNSEFGKKVTDHVWHCPVRTAPEDRHLSDTEWADIAQRIVEAAGIARPATTSAAGGSPYATRTTTSTSSPPPSVRTAAVPGSTTAASASATPAARSKPTTACAS